MVVIFVVSSSFAVAGLFAVLVDVWVEIVEAVGHTAEAAAVGIHHDAVVAAVAQQMVDIEPPEQQVVLPLLPLMLAVVVQLGDIGLEMVVAVELDS